MKLIVGLGNPGIRYKNTKHNAGFWVIDELAAAEKISLKKRSFNAQWGQGQFAGEQLILAKPFTFMNLSGKAVKGFVDYFKIKREDVLVVVDDVDLELGSIRMRSSGSAGGHKGLRSIIEDLGFSDFARLRLGIKTDTGCSDLSEYVLSNFKKEEEILRANEMIDLACKAVLCWLEKGIVFTMNKFNKKKVK